MSGERYKSLISDEEVIRELIKESKRREGKVTTARIKPNINFFQRTVVNLVSNNNRLNKHSTTSKKQLRHIKTPAYKVSSVRKPLIDHAFERQLVLQTKIKFIRSQSCNWPKDPHKKTIKPNIKHIIDVEKDEESVHSDDDDNKEIKCKEIARNYRSNKSSNQVIVISSDDSSTETTVIKKSKGKHRHNKKDTQKT